MTLSTPSLSGAMDFNTIPVAFSFKVSFLFTGVSPSASPKAKLAAAAATLAASAVDTSFSEVSGLDWKATTEEIEEGGRMEKRTVLKEIQYSDLVLKRGITPLSSPLAAWCNSLIMFPKTNSIVPATVIVNLLDANGAPSRSWVFDRAYPIAWAVDSFNSTDNKLAIESITLKHSGFMRIL